MWPFPLVSPAAAALARSARPAALVGLAALFLALSLQQINDTDLWWQMHAGRWVLEHRAVPTHDTFSYTARGHEWIEIRWLFCVLAYLAWELGGPALLVLAKALLLAAAYLLLAAPVWRTARTLPGLAVLGLAVAAAEFRFAVRPEVLTFLFLCVFLDALRRLARGGGRRAAWLLPPLQVLWANSHGLFILGPVAAWTHVIAHPRRRRLLVTSLAVTAACWLNAYGHRGAMFPLLQYQEMHDRQVWARASAELNSPFHPGVAWSYGFYAAALLCVLSAATFVRNWRRLDRACLAIWAQTLYLGCVSARNVALFALVAAWAALGNLDDLHTSDVRPAAAGRNAATGARHYPRPPTAIATAGLALCFFAAAAYVASNRYNVAMQAPRRVGLGVYEPRLPSAAADFLRHAAPRPQLFHSMTDGAYLGWTLGDRYPVYIDGRLEVFGKAFYATYLNRPWLSRNWQQYADRLGINTAVIQRDEFQLLAERLAESPHWILVHLDWRNLIFVRDIPAHADLIRRFRIDPRRPWTPRGPEPTDGPVGWLDWIGGVEPPEYAFGMAKSFLTVGGVDNAEPYLRRAVERSGGDRTVRLMLAQVCRSRGDDAQAQCVLAGLRLTPDERIRGERMLAAMLRSRGRHAAAADVLRGLVQHGYGDAAVVTELARLLRLAGNRAAAADCFAAAARLASDDPEPWLEAAQLFGELGRPEAEAYLREARRLDPDYVAAAVRGSASEAK